MGVGFYMVAALVAIILILVLVVVIMAKRGKRLKDKAQEAEKRAASAEIQTEKLKTNIDAVLDYDKQDALLVKQREVHIDALVKTRSKTNAENEIKTLMLNLRDAYNAQ